jgi:hypothetical protein
MAAQEILVLLVAVRIRLPQQKKLAVFCKLFLTSLIRERLYSTEIAEATIYCKVNTCDEA